MASVNPPLAGFSDAKTLGAGAGLRPTAVSGEELGDELEEGGAFVGLRRVADEDSGASARGLGCARDRGNRFGILTDHHGERERVGAHSPGCIFE